MEPNSSTIIVSMIFAALFAISFFGVVLITTYIYLRDYKESNQKFDRIHVRQSIYSTRSINSPSLSQYYDNKSIDNCNYANPTYQSDESETSSTHDTRL